MSDWEIIDTPAGPARLKRTRRKTLALSVLPDGSLELVAPEGATLDAVLLRVEKRLSWIRTQCRTFHELNATRSPLRYVNGATHRYLGRQYRLKVRVGEGVRTALRGGYFHVTVPELTEASVKAALDAWYRLRAKEQFQKRLSGWTVWCRNRRLPAPKLRVRQMAKRWGSALSDGTICLTPDLIRAPSICLDYVIAHEICHLRYPDHGAQFRRLLDVNFPGWRTVKERLEQVEL